MKIDVEFTKRMKEEEIRFYKEIKGVIGKNNVNSNNVSVNSESLMALKVDKKRKMVNYKKMIKKEEITRFKLLWVRLVRIVALV